MLELTGTLKERLDQAIRLSNAGVTEEQVLHFREVYKKAQIPLLPAAEAFYVKYGGVFKKGYIALADPRYKKEICFGFAADYTNSRLSDPERAAFSWLDDAKMDIDDVREFAKQEVCPVGEIGYYYPAEVFVGENGLLYCVYSYQDEIEVFTEPSEILEAYLKYHEVVGYEEKR